MGISLLFYSLLNSWPFKVDDDDIKASNLLVRKLPIPEHIKQFVYAVQEPQTGAILYILCAHCLSEQSASDADCLIKAVRPDAVIAQLPDFDVPEFQNEDTDADAGIVPNTFMGVVKMSFFEELDKKAYELIAENLVLKEIFGIGYAGHLLAAKNAAKEIGSQFLVLESPYVTLLDGEKHFWWESEARKIYPVFASSVVSQKLLSAAGDNPMRFFRLNELRLQMLCSMAACMDAVILRVNPRICEAIRPVIEYVPPPFAESMYPLFSSLHNIYSDIPWTGRALASVQELFVSVNAGEHIDAEVLNDVFTFRILNEFTRMVFNRRGRRPLNRIWDNNTNDAKFFELSADEKAHAMLAQTLRYQCGKYKSVVAVVDVICLEGLRKHWGASVPKEVKDLTGECVTSYEDYIVTSTLSDKRRVMRNNSMLRIGIGATAVLGASSLSNVIPASRFIKLLKFSVPAASLKLVAAKNHIPVAIALSKAFGPFRVVTPGLAGCGAKSVSTMKAIDSGKTIRTITQVVIASAENTSLMAMRAAFYHIMRNRAVRPIGVMPWATFGISLATCAGLIMHGEGLECAAESLPTASDTAKLGRGIENLHQTALQTDRSMLQRTLEALMYKLKKAKYM